MDNKTAPTNELGNKNTNTHHKNNKKRYYNNKHKQNKKRNEETAAEAVTVSENQAQKPVNTDGHKKHRKHNKPHHKQNAQKKELEQKEQTEELLVENLPATTTPDVPLSDDFSELDAFEAKKEEVTTSEETKQVDVIGIRFKAGGKTYYFEPNGVSVKRGQYAIVETARGQEFGEVALANITVPESEIVPPLRPVIRIATDADVKHHADNKVKEEEAFKICNEKIIAHGLDMKLIDAQYTFDNSKLLFYFSSSGRVDFRELVKDLASVFKTRIELRQIGIRDEAKLIGGLGVCGRPICCSVFLTDFGQVSIKMAKEQNLSLNSAKISGVCGRLMCCLRYEYDTYLKEAKNFPAIESKVKTPDGVGTVTEINIIAGKIKVKLDEKPELQPKSYTKDSVTILPNEKQ